MKSIEKISINMLGAVALLISTACVVTSCGETKTTEIGTVVETPEEEELDDTSAITEFEIIDDEISSEDVLVEDSDVTPTSIPSPGDVIKKDSLANDATSAKESTDKKDESKVEGKRQAMEINSPEGWTRVRKEPTTNSKELFKVKPEKKFYVTKIEGSEWCKFYWTEDGKQEGYIHCKYVKPITEKKEKNKDVAKEGKATGKYHVIIGSFDDFDNAKAKYEQLSKWADAEMFLEKEKKKYRVSIYSSTDKSKAESVKADVAKDGYPDAWILKY